MSLQNLGKVKNILNGLDLNDSDAIKTAFSGMKSDDIGMAMKSLGKNGADISNVLEAVSDGSEAATLAINKFGNGSKNAIENTKNLFTGILSSIKSALPFLLAAATIFAAFKIADWAITTPDEANESMAAHLSEYETAKSEVEKLNSDLETTNARIAELEAKGGLTILEKGELENLREAMSLLKIQKDLAEREVENEGREAAQASLDAYKNNFYAPISAETTELLKSSNRLTDWGNGKFTSALLDNERNISGQIAGLQLLQEELAGMDVGTDEWENCNNKITEVTDNIWDQVSTLTEYKANLEAIPKSLRTEEQKAAIKEISNAIGYVYQELDPAKWKSMQLDEILSKDTFAKAKQELVEMAKASNNIGISSEYVEQNYKQLVRELKAAGITVDEFVDGINSEAGIINYDVVKNQLKTSFDSNSENSFEEVQWFVNWMNELSPEDLQLVYTISLNTDTSNYGPEDWLEALDFYKKENSDLEVVISAETEGLETVKSALSETASTTGLTAASVSALKSRYANLEGFDAGRLFENTAAGIMLNTNYLKQLESQYEELNNAKIEKKLADAKAEYDALSESIANCNNSNEISDMEARQEVVEDEIDSLERLKSEYDGLTSEFAQFQLALETPGFNSSYNELGNQYKNMKKILEAGWYGNDELNEYIDSVLGADNRTDDIVADFKKVGQIIDKYWSFSGEDIDTDGLFDFLDDVNAKLGDSFAGIDENGKYFFDFSGDKLQQVADAFGMSTEMVTRFAMALREAGMEVNLDDFSLDSFLNEYERTGDVEGITDGMSTEELKEALTFLNNEINKVKQNKLTIAGQVDPNIMATLDTIVSRVEEDYQLRINVVVNEPEESEFEEPETTVIEDEEVPKSSAPEVEVDDFKVDRGASKDLGEEISDGLSNIEVDKNSVDVDKDVAENVSEEISDNAEIELDKNGVQLDRNVPDEISSELQDGVEAVEVPLKADKKDVEDATENEKDTTATVTVEGTEELQQMKDNLSALESKNVKVAMNVSGMDQLITALAYYNSLQDKTVTITIVTRYVNGGGGGGGGGAVAVASGTAHLSGTAYASGHWGTTPGGAALVGELGPEIVVDPRTSRWYTVGDQGAQFASIPKGSIVFNHKQSKALLENGRISSRGTALASGTALVDGANGNRKPVVSSGGGSGSKNNNEKGKEPDYMDWIEVLIDRIERTIDRIARVAESAFKNFTTRSSATFDQMDRVNEEIELQQQAYDRYLEQAYSVGLSEELSKLAINGAIDISLYDEATQKKIDQYLEWYEKAIEAQDTAEELQENLAELYQDHFDMIQENFESQIDMLEHSITMIENQMDIAEANGMLASAEYYKGMQEVERKNIETLNKEREELVKAFDEAMESGKVQEGSEAWYEMKSAINEVDEAISDANLSLAESAQSIREIEWDHFDYLLDRISQLTSEADFLVGLMENDKLHGDNGELTDVGMATMGLHAMNYDTYMSQADKYRKELLKIDKQLADDPYNTQLIERREELLSLQQDSIASANEEKQAIMDLVEEGIEAELDSLDELIGKYTDALDSAKDLYDYQKKVADHTSEISTLRKQLLAYEGDDSEETKATVQKLKTQLEEAEDNLEETEYDRYIDDQKQLLDELYTEYEEILNERLDNIDTSFEEMIGTVNSNADLICETISKEAANVGYALSGDILSIWKDMSGGEFSSVYGDGFSDKDNVTNALLGKIEQYVSEMVSQANKGAEDFVSNEAIFEAPVVEDTYTQIETRVEFPEVEETTPVTPTPGYTGGYYGDYSGGNTGSSSNSNKINSIIKSSAENAAKTLVENIAPVSPSVTKPSASSSTTTQPSTSPSISSSTQSSSTPSSSQSGGFFSNIINGVTGFFDKLFGNSSNKKPVKLKTGGLVDYTGLAMLDGTFAKPELVLNPNDTENFIQLRDILRNLSTQELTMSRSHGYVLDNTMHANRLIDVSDMMSTIRSGSYYNAANSTGDINIDIAIDHVSDYNDFVNQLRGDAKFEKMIKAMTTDELAGRGQLGKYKSRW